MENDCVKCKVWNMESKENGYYSGICEECFKKYYVAVNLPYQPERSKREDYKVTTINGHECPKIEMPIDKDILTKYKWESIDAVL